VRDLVRDGGHERCEHRVQRQLREAPAKRHHRDVRRHRQHREADRTAGRTERGPRQPPAEAPRRPVRDRPEHGVGHHRHRRAEADDQTQRQLLAVGRERLRLPAEQHLDRAVERGEQAQPGEREQRGPAGRNPYGRLGHRWDRISSRYQW
jgi:hypothetical protein